MTTQKTKLFQQAFNLENQLMNAKNDFQKYPLNSVQREHLYKLYRKAIKRTNRRYNA